VRHSPLDERHRNLGARMAEFGGWEMPLEYGGTIGEHLACRAGAALFDVSHLGTVRVSGPSAFATLQTAFTNDLGRIQCGRAQYTHLLDTEGSVVDDIIVWWYRTAGGAEVFDVMPNASNISRVVEAIGGEDVTATRAVIALQGPASRLILRSVFPEAAEVGRFRVASVSWRGQECVIAGTGYTGESGVEIAAAPTAAGELWDQLIEAGAVPAGLGARDTLRLEAGLPLHGHELGAGITPYQAGLGWVVALDKGEFRGRSALIDEASAGPIRRLVGIASEGRRPPRADSVIRVGGSDVGTVTSGNFSPVLGHGIALGFVPAEIAEGSSVEIVGRSATLTGTIVPIPFVAGSIPQP